MKIYYSETFSDTKKIAVLDLVEAKKKLFVITRLSVPLEHRNQGVGSRLLKQLIEDADNESVTLLVEPRPYFDRTTESYDKLKKFYSKFRFETVPLNEGLMIRKPKER